MRSSTATRLPLIVYALAGGIFLLGTSEFMIAGLLPDIAHDLHTSNSHTGLLITAFAIGMAVGAPAMTVLTLRLPRHTTLTAALLIFAVGHTVSALSSSFVVQFVARFVSAVATGTFWAVSAVVAAAAVPLMMRARALAVIMGGLTVSNVAGVPIGTLIGQDLGWRVMFWLVGGGAVLVIAVLLPLLRSSAPQRTNANGDAPRIRAEIAALRNRPLWLTLGTITVFQIAGFGLFSYVSPLLTDAAGIPKGAVPLVLVLYGLGAFAGSMLGGRIGDAQPKRLVLGTLVALIVVFALIATLGHVAALTIVLLGMLGVGTFALAIPLVSRVIGLAGDAPTLASATGTSAFNIGNAIGPFVGGIALSHVGPTGPAALGIALTMAALGIALTAFRHVDRLDESSGAESDQWRDIPRHSRDSAPLSVCGNGVTD